MKDFAYARADGNRRRDRAGRRPRRVLAGGTELLNWVRLGIAEPEQIIDIGGVEELRGVPATARFMAGPCASARSPR